MQRNH